MRGEGPQREKGEVECGQALSTMCFCMLSGAAKLGLLCELYTRNKKDMSKGEKHEVLEYVRGR